MTSYFLGTVIPKVKYHYLNQNFESQSNPKPEKTVKKTGAKKIYRFFLFLFVFVLCEKKFKFLFYSWQAKLIFYIIYYMLHYFLITIFYIQGVQKAL